jgi:spermidine synthase
VLAGISVGSFVGGRWLYRWRDPLRLLARVQLGVGLSILVALHLFPYLRTALFWPPVLLLSPVSLLWGLAFPLGAAAYTRSPALPGRSIGALYAWNTVGCIAGSLAAGFILIPCLGSSASLASLAAVSLLLGALLLTVHPQGLRQARASDGALAAAALLLLPLLGDAYYQALERRLLDWFPGGIEVHSYVEEAAATTIAFQRTGHSEMHKQLFVNGEGMTCLAPVTKLMAHLPLALADNPRDALVICMGMGTSLRSACAHEGLRVHAVELIPAVVRAFDFFHPDARGLLQQPQVHVVVDDGRNYLLLNQQKYDVITIDPPPPLFAAGTVNLYTRDFLALCRDRLQPQGVFCLWIQPDPVSENKMLFRSLLDVFEHVQVWTGPTPHTGFLMIATLQPLAMSEVPAKVRRLYDKPAIAADLRTWGDALDQPAKILDLYATSGAALRKYCSDAPLLADDRPYTEFPLWRRLRKDNEYHTIMSGTSYKQFPGAVDPYR